MDKEQTQSQEIMRLKAEIEAKETNRKAFSKAYDKLRAENSTITRPPQSYMFVEGLQEENK